MTPLGRPKGDGGLAGTPGLERFRLIVVEGPIGAGKTSVARRLAARLRAKLLLEAPQDNPFLARFYGDRPRHALAVQLHFLYQRIEQIEAAHEAGLFAGPVVGDFLLEKDALFAAYTLPDDEFALYRRIRARLTLPRLTPDLVVVLQAPVEALLTRVQRRALGAEAGITEPYLRGLSERYASFLHGYDEAPVLTVDTAHLNPVDVDADLDLLLARIGGMRGRREHFGYTG
jgi:deoxyadenosine/deoxycytidine kinase